VGNRVNELAAARIALLRSEGGGDLARAAIWHWDLKDGSVEWAPDLRALFGYSVRVTDAAWRESRIHPDDQNRVALSLHRATVVNNGSVWSERYRFRRADGSHAAVVERAYVLHDEQGPRWVLGALAPAAAAPHLPRTPRPPSRTRSGG
jgi:PAS domain-containing protein